MLHFPEYPNALRLEFSVGNVFDITESDFVQFQNLPRSNRDLVGSVFEKSVDGFKEPDV
jgi:hypothetical protein